MIKRIGFIGTGTITEAVVSGIATAPGLPPEIWVSPRNAEVSARLAQAHAFVHVGRDNQDVVDRCDVVCLCVRPQIAEEVLGALRFSAGHRILSFIATWNLQRLSATMPHVSRIARLAPLPMVAQHAGPTIIYPPDEIAAHLFRPLGQAIEVTDEATFDTLLTATALMGPFFATLDAVGTWLDDHGVAGPQARSYLGELFRGLGAIAQHRDSGFAELSREFSTVGGLNEQFTRELDERGVFEAYGAALDQVRNRIGRR
ncbi:pyrroline-5-carboxylate reductase [Burkholderia sp. WAC0059]|uniref:pyrroline-5-carboxylate reductase n=1 Tax=Burkholderia sp. WAC0059 TaxID=2066022 RepID=UPI0021556CEF|nr:pyrroline-5-carboxylate reductase [Burkholderia sp. WAC0059]